MIEVGCGFSSALLLDTCDFDRELNVEITLIDPGLEGAIESFADLGAGCARLMPARLQHVPLREFELMEAGDVLFIDSSHVSKTASDVNWYLFEIFPRLEPGVIVHIHDVLYPFEYLEGWVIAEHRGWNEAYLIRAFLQDNPKWEILYWNNFATHRLGYRLEQLMPLCLDNEGGSLWLRKAEHVI